MQKKNVKMQLGRFQLEKKVDKKMCSSLSILRCSFIREKQKGIGEITIRLKIDGFKIVL